jgi:hypothetical protein
MPAGKPRKYKDAEAMRNRVELYFEETQGEGRPPTIAGLALALGFADRQSLYDYEALGDEYSCVLKAARARIEQAHEERLFANGCTGSIFWLKTHGGLKETVHVDQTSSDGSMSPKAVPDDLAAALNSIATKLASGS